MQKSSAIVNRQLSCSFSLIIVSDFHHVTVSEN